jgi:hypothetical protein
MTTTPDDQHDRVPASQAKGELPSLPPRSIIAMVADLSRPLPVECLARIESTTNPKTGKTRPAQDYLHWHTVTAALDTYAPGWEGRIVRIDKIGERIVVVYRLTLHAAEGTFSQDGDGMEDEDKDDFGDAMTSAVATALKRAAAKFGLGRNQLYDKDKRTAAFLSAVRRDKEVAVQELAGVADAKGYPRSDVLAWLCRQAGVVRVSDIPTYTLKAMARQLEAQPDVPRPAPVPEAVNLDTGELHDMPPGWLTDQEQRALSAREEAALLEQANT